MTTKPDRFHCGTAGCISGWLAAEIACDGVAWQQDWDPVSYDELMAGWLREHDHDAWRDGFALDAPDVIAATFNLSADERQALDENVYAVMDSTESLANFAALFGLDTTSSASPSEANGQS